MDQTLLLWGGFTLFIGAMLALDIGLFIERRMSSGSRRTPALDEVVEVISDGLCVAQRQTIHPNSRCSDLQSYHGIPNRGRRRRAR